MDPTSRITFDRIKAELDAAEHVLVISHQKPDGDCIGAGLAMSHYLKQCGKAHVCFCVDAVPEHLRYLPRSEHYVSTHERVLEHPIDRIVVVDSGDLEYAGVADLVEKLQHRKPAFGPASPRGERGSTGGRPVVINIDHHPTNAQYGHVNLVHPQASSTCEILFHFFDHHNVPIDKDMATCLLTGILTDTGSFSNLATTQESLEAASRLLARGARLKKITHHTFKNKSIGTLQLWGRVFSRLREDPATGTVTTAMFRKDFEELGIADDAVEGVTGFLNNLKQTKLVAVLKEERGGGRVKVSLRTTHPDVDVAKLAKSLGGGGHKKAAGFTVDGTIAEQPERWEIVRPDGSAVPISV